MVILNVNIKHILYIQLLAEILVNFTVLLIKFKKLTKTKTKSIQSYKYLNTIQLSIINCFIALFFKFLF